MRPWLLLLLWGLAGVLPVAVSQVTRCTFTRADILESPVNFGKKNRDTHRPSVFTVTAPFPHNGRPGMMRRDAARAVFNRDVSIHHIFSQKSLNDWTADWIKPDRSNATLDAIAEGFTWLAGNITGRQAKLYSLYPINQTMSCRQQLGTWVWESFMWVSRIAAFGQCVCPLPAANISAIAG